MRFITTLFLLIYFSSNSLQSQKIVQSVSESRDPLIENPEEFVGKHKTKVALLGIFHFHNPGMDSYKPVFDFDILSVKRQLENTVLLEKLSVFKPTKIVLEANRIEYDSILNSEYSNYLKGKFDISDKRNELYQVGFQLGKKLGHKTLYSADAKAQWFGVDLDWDNYDDIAYVKSRGQYEKYIRYDYNKIYRKSDSLKTVLSLEQYLHYLNEPQNRLKNHQGYLTSIIEGAGDNYLGADNVARWYRRNLRIFSNIYDIADFNKEDRLLIIYGAGHVYQLRQFLIDSPDFEYIEMNEFLEK